MLRYHNLIRLSISSIVQIFFRNCSFPSLSVDFLVDSVVIGVRSYCRVSFTMESSETLGDEVTEKLLLLELIVAGLGDGDNTSSGD